MEGVFPYDFLVYRVTDLLGLDPCMAKRDEWDYKELRLGSGASSLFSWPTVYLAKDKNHDHYSIRSQRHLSRKGSPGR